MTPPLAEPTGVVLAAQPHHDAGPSFLPVPPRALDDVVTLRVWVPGAYPVAAIALRAVIDGEIWTTSAERVGDEQGTEVDPDGTWWEARLRAANPVVPYRFCVVGAPDAEHPVPAYAWLTAAGLVPWDVSDATDFRLVVHDPAPDWVDDAIVYQIFPDRFARSTGAPRDAQGRALAPAGAELPEWAVPMAWDDEPAVRGDLTGRQFFGGDLDGIVERLDHIASLGADTVYLTPVFPAGSVHRYDASTFDRVDELLGGDAALVRLAGALHARGMRLLLDLTTNHTGDTHEWFTAARADADSPEAGYYLFDEHPDSYAAWLDVPSLPKLDHRSEAVRDKLVRGPGSVVGRWLAAPVEADGWRIDVANMTGRHGDVDLARDVARDIRATMAEAEARTGRPGWLVAEHGHDATGDLLGDGWHGTMNYTGFTRPLWTWLVGEGSELNWLGLPMTVPSLGGDAISRTLRDYNAQMPWASRAHSMNQLSSHDTPRTRTVVGSAARQIVAVGALAALPGVPTVFAGDELGAEGVTGEHARTPMPWAALDAEVAEGAVGAAGDPGFDPEVLAATRRLLGLRRADVALRRGGLRWLHASPDVLAFARTHPDGDTVVCLVRDAAEEIVLDLACLPGVRRVREFAREGAVAAGIDGRVLALAADGPGVLVVRAER
ncbi:glycoside hydrolase family 13 protein [Brachybacterium huguangmaarense]